VLARVFVISAALLVATPTAGVSAHGAPADAPVETYTVANPPADTINDFFPEQRPLGDCLSSLPKPDCGSDARGGWRQAVVLVAILSGLALIVWRIVVQSRKART
jgi:hypothetical protein